MPDLIVNVDDEIAVALRRRAAARGHSTEAEHRTILRRALLGESGFKDALLSMPDVGEDEDFARVQGHSQGVKS